MKTQTNRKQPYIFGAGALLAVVLAVLLCCIGTGAEPVVLSDPGSGGDTARAFLDTLCAGDYEGARAFCPELPEDAVPEDAHAAALHEKLTALRSWEPHSDFVRTGARAVGSVSFTYLDLSRLTADMKPEVNAVLARYVEEARHHDDIYDESGSYREDVVEAAWDEAFSTRLERAEEYLTTAELPLELRYTGRCWEVQCSEELLCALRGGV